MFVTHYATTEPPKFTVEGGTRSVVGAGVAQTSQRQLRTSEHFHHGTVGMDQPVLRSVDKKLRSVDSVSAPLNNRQDQVRGMHAIVIDTIDHLHEVLLGFRLNRATRIG